jgi:uncharacterized protein YycO
MKRGILLAVDLRVETENDLDFNLLEPGDLLLVANPTDIWLVRYLLFWSHVGMVADRGLVDAVRDPRGDYIEQQRWGTVQWVPYRIYRANHDILALRVKCSREKRAAAARYALQKVGLPYSPTLRTTFLGHRETDCYSCASLVWQAYLAQGIDLYPFPGGPIFNVLPSFILRSSHVEVIARGVRPERATGAWPKSRLAVERLWFKYVLHSV